VRFYPETRTVFSSIGTSLHLFLHLYGGSEGCRVGGDRWRKKRWSDNVAEEEGERGAGEGDYSRLFLILVACARK